MKLLKSLFFFALSILIVYNANAGCLKVQIWAEDDDTTWEKDYPSEFSARFRFYKGSTLIRSNVSHPYAFDGNKTKKAAREPMYYHKLICSSLYKGSNTPTGWDVLLWEDDYKGRTSYDTRSYGNDDDLIWKWRSKGKPCFYPDKADYVGVSKCQNYPGCPSPGDSWGVRQITSGMSIFQFGTPYIFRNKEKHPYSKYCWSNYNCPALKKNVLDNGGYIIIKITPDWSGWKQGKAATE
jgi:hypothetical protein